MRQNRHKIVVIAGVTTTAKVAHLRLCHSRMFYVRAYPRATQQMEFDAHDLRNLRVVWRRSRRDCCYSRERVHRPSPAADAAYELATIKKMHDP